VTTASSQLNATVNTQSRDCAVTGAMNAAGAVVAGSVITSASTGQTVMEPVNVRGFA